MYSKGFPYEVCDCVCVCVCATVLLFYAVRCEILWKLRVNDCVIGCCHRNVNAANQILLSTAHQPTVQLLFDLCQRMKDITIISHYLVKKTYAVNSQKYIFEYSDACICSDFPKSGLH